MATKKRGLGRGLDALLGGARPTANTRTEKSGSPGSQPAPAEAASDKNRLKELPVDLVQRGRYQPRVDMHADSLNDLADSIRAQGIVQPITVRAIADGRYEIIAGERRWRAAQLAGLESVPAVIRDVDDQAAMAMALIENIQREDLNPIEEAQALRRLLDEFELTHQQIAEAVGRSRASVSNLLRLLELEPSVRDQLVAGELEMGHARALLALKPDQQRETGRQITRQGLSVRQTEQLVRRMASGKARKKPPAGKTDPNLVRLEQDLADRLGATVHLRPGARGKGKLVIEYSSLDELDGILSHIQ